MTSRKKEELFFVDTKSTCFLCLQNVVASPASPPPIIILGDPAVPQGDAVFPQNGEESGRGVAGKREKEEPFCLRRIFKFLQLDPGKVLREQLTTGPFLGSNLGATDLSVVLCAACREVGGQLSEVFREWELLQMKLDHSVQNLAEILKKSEGDPRRGAAFREEMIDPLDLLYRSITELMRKETLERCTKHLQKSLPRVSVVAAEEVPFTNPVSDPGAPEAFVSHTPPPPPSDLDSDSTESENEISPAKDDEAPATTLSLAELLSKAPRIKGDNGEVHLCCSICPSSNAPKFGGDAPLKEHIFTRHPDYFFASAKLPLCSELRFRALCSQLLESEETTSFLQCDLGKGRGTFANCVHCTYHCRGDDRWSKYAHMVQGHYPIYAAKLGDLQKLERPSPAKETPSSSPRSPYPITCIGCQQVFPTYSSYRRHQITNFCGGLKLAFPENLPSQPFRCGDCGKTFLCQTSIRRHQELHCLHRRNPTPVPAPYRGKAAPLSQPIRCRNCGKAFLSAFSARRHLCTHLDAPAPSPSENRGPKGGQPCKHCRGPLSKGLPCPCGRKKTASSEKSAGFHCKVCGTKIAYRTNMWSHMNKFCPYRHSKVATHQGVFLCFHCHGEFPFLADLRQHIASAHLEGGGGPTPFFCEDCDSTLSSYGALIRHKKQYCSKVHAAKAPRSAGTEGDGEAEEEELEEMDQSSGVFNPAKIEVLEPREVQLSLESEMTAGTMEMMEGVAVKHERAYPEELAAPPGMSSFNPAGGVNGGKMEGNDTLVLPDEVDPLLFL